jgi:hypothetical protein
MLKPWLALTYKTIQLGLDAQNVVALRLMRLAAGGARGQNEVRRMVTEKIAAGVEAQAIVGLGIITATRTVVADSPPSFAETSQGEQTPIVS